MNILVPHLLRHTNVMRSETMVSFLLLITIVLFSGSLFAADVTQTTVTLSWTAPGDDGGSGTAAQYDIRYSTAMITGSNWNSATQVSGEPTPQSAGSMESMMITGLNPGTTYYFAIRAADEMPNWSAISNVVAVTTLSSDLPPAAIITLTPTSVTNSTVQLSWLAPGEDSLSGTASVYDVRYSTSLITAANWDAASQASGEPTPLSAGSLQSFTVTGLSAGVQYYFAIKTADAESNWSGLSNVVSTTTGAEQVAPGAISNLAINTIAANSVTLTWTAPGDDGTVGTASQYQIRYAIWPITELNWNSAASAPNPPSPQAAGSAESFEVTGLLSGATYYFAVKTADEVPNWSLLSNVVSTVTADNVAPNPITDLDATTGDNAGDLILTWTSTGDDGMSGTCHHYIIAYSTEELTAANWQTATIWPVPPTPLSGGHAQECTLTGLAEATQYWAVVVAVDEAGNNSGISNIANGESGFEFGTGTGDDDDNSGLPEDFELMQNYPNPFNPTTTIEYAVPEQSYVNLSVYNVLGQLVTTLVDDEKGAGVYTTVWDGRDDFGAAVSSGIYFYTIQTDSYRQSRKMVLMK
ncbi:MAG: fibronectin type III domain-containing protein [Candidatus Zixiibacteriota bacterium]